MIGKKAACNYVGEIDNRCGMFLVVPGILAGRGVFSLDFIILIFINLLLKFVLIFCESLNAVIFGVLSYEYFFTSLLFPPSPSSCLTPSNSSQFTLELPTFRENLLTICLKADSYICQVASQCHSDNITCLM